MLSSLLTATRRHHESIQRFSQLIESSVGKLSEAELETLWSEMDDLGNGDNSIESVVEALLSKPIAA